MEDTDKDSKTETATDKRVSDSLDEGNVPFSREVPLVASIVVFWAYYASFGNGDSMEISTILHAAVDSNVRQEPISNPEMFKLIWQLFSGVAIALSPFFVALVVSGLLSSILQNQPRLISNRIAPKFSRISPAAGWKRLNSAKNYFDFLKSLMKVALFLSIFSFQMDDTIREVTIMVRRSADAAPVAIASLVSQMIAAVCIAAVAVAAVDLVWQRKNWLNDLKMTLQQVKDEIKQAEGDPIVKSRLRSLGRSRARNRMMKSVPTATLIIANPTHIAIALRYDRARDAAPVVVAMGADLIAQRIREIASDHAIPVFEQVDLARALFKVVRVDQIIPQNFYQALAVLIREIER